MISFWIIILSLLGYISKVKSDDKCRILVLEGGGDRGAYHSGAFYEMVELLPPQEVAYDIITGISAGGLNTAAISFFEKGDEKNAREFLKNIWDTIQRKNVWQTWKFWNDPINGEKGLLDTSPLRAYLTNLADKNTIKRQFIIGTTDQIKGNLLRIRNDDVPTVDDKVNALMSTSAIPGVFPFNSWRNSIFVDGGQMKMMDVVGGVQYCREQGFQDNQIIVDAILCVGKNRNDTQTNIKTTLQNTIKSLDNFAYEQLYKDIDQAYEDYPEVNYRLLISPDLFQDLDVFLLFDHDQLELLQQSGRSDAQKEINKLKQGEVNSFRQLLNQYKSKEISKKQNNQKFLDI